LVKIIGLVTWARLQQASADIGRALSVILLLSNDANTAARQSKNYPNAAGAADLLEDIMTQPLGLAREPVRQLCTIGQQAENLRPGRLRPVIGFAANAKMACSAAAHDCSPGDSCGREFLLVRLRQFLHT
jgi:hypothetical protein